MVHKRVTDLHPIMKLCKLQLNTSPMQLIWATTPNVLKQTPMPQMSRRCSTTTLAHAVVMPLNVDYINPTVLRKSEIATHPSLLRTQFREEPKPTFSGSTKQRGTKVAQ